MQTTLCKTKKEYHPDFWDLSEVDTTINNVVYKLTFPDDSIYIGKTNRPLHERLSEHVNNSKSNKRLGKRINKCQKHIMKYLDAGNVKVDIIFHAENESKDTLYRVEHSHIKECSHYTNVLNTFGLH